MKVTRLCHPLKQLWNAIEGPILFAAGFGMGTISFIDRFQAHSAIFVKHINLPQACPDANFFSALPKPFCFPSCFCSLLMWPFDERLQNWVETHWFSSLRPRSIRGGRCIFKDAGETINNDRGFYVRRFLKTWVVAWQTLNNMIIYTHTTRQCLPQLCWMLATSMVHLSTGSRSCKVAQRRKYRTCCKLFLHGSVLNRSSFMVENCESFFEPFIWTF